MEDAPVKVSAQTLNRMTTLTMELLVQLGQFKILKDSLLELKVHDLHLIHLLDTVLHLPEEEGSIFLRQKALEETRHKIRSRMQYAWKALEYFDKLTGRTNLFSEQLYQTLLANTTRPFGDCVQGLPRLTHSLSEALGKHIHLDLQGKDVSVDRHLLEGIEKCLNHIVRNACDHGIEAPEERLQKNKGRMGLIRVKAYHQGGFLMIAVQDDGRGINIAALQKRVVDLGLIGPTEAEAISRQKLVEYIFLPGVSTAQKVSEVSGRGVGLDVVRHFLEQERGSIQIHTHPEEGTAFLLQLPLMRSVLKTIVVRLKQGLYAFHKERIEAVFSLNRAKVHESEGAVMYHNEGQSFLLMSLGELLELGSLKLEEGQKIILLRSENHSFGLVVEAIEGEDALLVQPVHRKLGKIPCVSASSFNEAGEPIFILDIGELLLLLKQKPGPSILQTIPACPSLQTIPTCPSLQSIPACPSCHFSPASPSFKVKTLLWVDDSPLIRERIAPEIIASSAHQLVTAKDATEALSILEKKAIDLLITDLDMPQLSGEALIEAVRKRPSLSELPILIVSSKEQADYPSLAQERFISKNHNLKEACLQAIGDCFAF